MALAKRLGEISARKAEIRKEVSERGKELNPDEIEAFNTEVDTLNVEEAQLRSRVDLTGKLGEPETLPEQTRTGKTKIKERAENFRASGVLKIPMFYNERSLLVSSGKLATPTAVSTEIGDLPSAVSSIVDDVYITDATGTGAWDFPYKTTDAVAASVTEGSTIGGTGAEYDKVTIQPGTWGVLDEVSNQVSKMTDVAYAANVQASAHLALRREARNRIVSAVLASTLAETKNRAIDADYLRGIVLGFGADDSVGGGTKLYLNRNDLYLIGKVRGTNEKRPLYDIQFTDETSGTITEGGMTVPFGLTSILDDGVQLYGQPKSVRMLLWGDYEISTDEGGDYFKRNMTGIRGLATAGVDLVVYHGMQIIKQAASE